MKRGVSVNKSRFVFFHGYDEKAWEGFVLRGLIDRNSGIRVCQSLLLPESKKFNSVAARGGKLFRLIDENNFPWYIDRLQGGGYFENYSYDMRLIDALRGEFYGFQIHEWASNMSSDYGKLSEISPSDWTEEGITKEIFRRFPYPKLFLEAASAGEYAEDFPMPKCREETLFNAGKLYRKRVDTFGRHLLPCDSAMLATNLEFKLGAKRVMPEIGAQTPCANIQIAYARGMARAYGREFGAYYESWGGEPFSVCSYCEGDENEWNIRANTDFPFETGGSEAGSSRSLQKRLFLYSYLAGASFISEEWGVYNTFLNLRDFELSPYGEIKRDFLRFIEKYPAGEFYAPVAVVLPKDMLIFTNPFTGWFNIFPYSDNEPDALEQHITGGMGLLMKDSVSQYGNENKTLPNSDIPDAFDIIHEDCENAFSRYEYLVDLTGNPKFSKNHKNAVSAQQAKLLTDGLMPCSVSGGVHWFVNKLDDGWYLTVFNNDGINKSIQNGECVMPEATRLAVIDIKNELSLTRLEGCADISARDGKYYVSIKGGDIFFAKIS
ncbi:MAG: hypothetical protein GX851_06490 [Clostridiales bacterium]|nr:hypothetical protein [Clostridiales bacterium]